MTYVWIFNGGGTFPAGVFSSLEKAEAWIRSHRLAGCLTRYPLDEGSYDEAVRTRHFIPKREDQATSEFIGRFSSGQVHFHYEDGEREA